MSFILARPLSIIARMQRADLAIVVAALILLFVYVGNALTPSSYALVLRHVGVAEADTGLVFGSPRPIRSDEWAHMTPWVQATVKNGLARYNEYSPYRDDFRATYGMPVVDWGLLFKPSLWLFPVTGAAQAYSFHFFFHAAAFLIGYTYLLVALGIRSRVTALAGATTLFFTGFVQGWWTVNAAAMSFIPLIALALLSIRQPMFKGLAVYWLLTSCAISLCYPPFILMGGLFCLAIVVVHRERVLPNIKTTALLACALTAAVLTTYLYLQEEITALMHTVYPGQRLDTRGGEMGLRQFAMQFYPNLYVHNFESLIGMNICEIGVVGSLFNLAALFFLDYARLKEVVINDRAARRFYLTFLGAFVYLVIWQLLPVPEIWGQISGMHIVASNRSAYLSGLLLFVALAHATNAAGLQLSVVRCVGFLAILLYPVAVEKLITFPVPPRTLWLDVAVIPALFAVTALLVRMLRSTLPSGWFAHPPAAINAALAVCCAAIGVLTWAAFNPLQSAVPIFARHSTPTTATLDRLTTEQGGKLLAVPARWGFPGAVLAGLGYPSIATATFRPALAFWRTRFGDLSEAEFSRIFNRTAHIVAESGLDTPILASAGLIVVPLERMLDKPAIIRWGDSALSPVRSAKLATSSLSGTSARLGGHIDIVRTSATGVAITGWAPWDATSTDQELLLAIQSLKGNPGHPTFQISTIRRDDVAKATGKPDLQWSGFNLDVSLREDSLAALSPCLVVRTGGEYFVLQGKVPGGDNQRNCAALGWRATGS